MMPGSGEPRRQSGPVTSRRLGVTHWQTPGRRTSRGPDCWALTGSPAAGPRRDRLPAPRPAGGPAPTLPAGLPGLSPPSEPPRPLPRSPGLARARRGRLGVRVRVCGPRAGSHVSDSESLVSLSHSQPPRQARLCRAASGQADPARSR